METCQVYILRSVRQGRYYTGLSSDVEKRLFFHNQGLNTSTRHGRPWELVWTSVRMEKSEGLVLEKRIKKRGAERFLQDEGVVP